MPTNPFSLGKSYLTSNYYVIRVSRSITALALCGPHRHIAANP